VAVASPGGDAECFTRGDHRGLEGADQGTDEEPSVREGDDRVGDELTGPVIGGLATPLHAHDLDAPAGQLRGRREHVRLVGMLAERQDRGVLQQKQPIADLAVCAGGGQSFLEIPGLAVRHAAEPLDVEGCAGGVGLGRADERGGVHRFTIAGSSLRLDSGLLTPPSHPLDPTVEEALDAFIERRRAELTA
jgi:hypothetical protein